MILIDGDRIVTALLYDDEYEEFKEEKISIIDFVNLYTTEGVTMADDVLDKIRAEIEKLQKSCDVAQDMFKENQEMVYCYKAFKQAYTKVIGIIDKYRKGADE